jgi:hypothetical protein
MKSFIFLILFIPLLASAQKIGQLAPEKPPVIFPPNSWGADIMLCEGGFGLGTFLRHNYTSTLTGFVDFSISESKDEKEIEYYDYWGNPYTVGKKNRVFLLPLNFGLQKRLFANAIDDNLRPYITFGVGPSMVVTTPYEREFFNSFSKAKAKYTTGGYFGLGANFGADTSSLVGISIRYYVVHFFDKGIESMDGRFEKNLGGFYLTINVGMMY